MWQETECQGCYKTAGSDHAMARPRYLTGPVRGWGAWWQQSTPLARPRPGWQGGGRAASGASTPRAELTTGLKCLTECMTSISRVALWHLVGITTSRTLTERSPSIILIALLTESNHGVYHGHYNLLTTSRFRDWKTKKYSDTVSGSSSLSRKIERQRSFTVKPPRCIWIKYI